MSLLPSCQQRKYAVHTNELYRAQRILAGIMLCLLLNSAHAGDATIPDHVGLISQQQLLVTYPSFAEEYKSYQPTPAQLGEIQALAGKEIVVLFGTWCHDSVREVPRILKLMDQAQVQVERLTLVGVSYQKDDPDGYSEKYDLRYTPTFVVSDQSGEIARIIEKPKDDLARDLAHQINAKIE